MASDPLDLSPVFLALARRYVRSLNPVPRALPRSSGTAYACTCACVCVLVPVESGDSGCKRGTACPGEGKGQQL